MVLLKWQNFSKKKWQEKWKKHNKIGIYYGTQPSDNGERSYIESKLPIIQTTTPTIPKPATARPTFAPSLAFTAVSFQSLTFDGTPYQDVVCNGACTKNYFSGQYVRINGASASSDPTCCPYGMCSFPSTIVKSISECEMHCSLHIGCSFYSYFSAPVEVCLLHMYVAQCEPAPFYLYGPTMQYPSNIGQRAYPAWALSFSFSNTE